MSKVVLLIHYLSHYLYCNGIPLIPSLIANFNRLVFSCYIGPGAKIGRHVVLGYGGLGCVIHGGCIIGDNVHIGSGVTIGGRSKIAEVPIIGNNTVIGSGAKILGPIKIGDECAIGANAVVLTDVMARSVVAGVPAVVKKTNIDIACYHNAFSKGGVLADGKDITNNVSKRD